MKKSRDLPAAAPSKTFFSSTKRIRDLAGSRQPEDEEYQEQHNEDRGEDFRDRERGSGDPRESEERRHQSDHEKHQSELEHQPPPGRAQRARAVPEAAGIGLMLRVPARFSLREREGGLSCPSTSYRIFVTTTAPSSPTSPERSWNC